MCNHKDLPPLNHKKRSRNRCKNAAVIVELEAVVLPEVEMKLSRDVAVIELN